MSACSGCRGCGSGGDALVTGVPMGEGVFWTNGGSPTSLEFDIFHGSNTPQPLRTEHPAARAHLHRLFQIIEAKRIPFWTHLDLTYKCNTNCIHCYCQHLDPSFGGQYDKQDLTTQEVMSLLDQLADYGVLNLTLSGGELFVRKDFFDIAFYASRDKHFALTLFSNGTLINEHIANRVAALMPVAVEISLLGATADVHDRVVQRPGSFQRVVQAVQLLRERGVNVVLKTTVMQPNFGQRGAIVALSRSLGARAYRSTIEITPKNDGDTSVTRYQLSDEQMLEYLANDPNDPWRYVEPVAVEEARKKSTCGTGTVGCYIGPYGDVYPCIQLLIAMGNIREQSFREIWEADSELRRKLDTIQTYGDLPDCQTCEYVQQCQRCHGLAYMETGDLTTCYKMALRKATIATRVNAMTAPPEHEPPASRERIHAGMAVETRTAGFMGFDH